MNNRVTLLVCLDTAMLLLVCMLEPIKITGLEWHQWLGFALCPLVLLHVILQWQWFATQFRNMGKSGGYRVRLSALLNLMLFVLMAAVLVSGVFVSRQSTELIGESLGRVRVWREVHDSFNFLLVIFVGLHLALNWDWILAVLHRRRPHRPGTDAVLTARRSLTPAQYLGRILVLLLFASVAAGATYFAIKTTLPPGTRARLQNHPAVTVKADYLQKKRLAPSPRAADFWDGLFNFAISVLIVLLAAIVGRYVFRLRL
jgi:cytochrome b561